MKSLPVQSGDLEVWVHGHSGSPSVVSCEKLQANTSSSKMGTAFFFSFLVFSLTHSGFQMLHFGSISQPQMQKPPLAAGHWSYRREMTE